MWDGSSLNHKYFIVVTPRREGQNTSTVYTAMKLENVAIHFGNMSGRAIKCRRATYTALRYYYLILIVAFAASIFVFYRMPADRPTLSPLGIGTREMHQTMSPASKVISRVSCISDPTDLENRRRAVCQWCYASLRYVPPASGAAELPGRPPLVSIQP